MKNKKFFQRLSFAIKGIKSAWSTEKSFRTQTLMASGALILLLIFKPEPLWWAVFASVIGAVLALELVNTALEYIVDLLHPEEHPMIARAKDCAAGAVLVMSLASLGVLAAFLFSRFKN